MKIRYDFVTNSSSSSFIIAKKNLDGDQIRAIREHHRLYKKMGLFNSYLDYPYKIEEDENFITGYVEMDNLNMDEFLKIIHVNPRDIEWGEYPFDLETHNENNEELDWKKLLYEDTD